MPSSFPAIATATQAMTVMALGRSATHTTRSIGKRPTPVLVQRMYLSMRARINQFKVVRVHASPVPARVVHTLAFRNLAFVLNVGKTMGAGLPILAIPILVNRECPIPASGHIVNDVTLGYSHMRAWPRSLSASVWARTFRTARNAKPGFGMLSIAQTSAPLTRFIDILTGHLADLLTGRWGAVPRAVDAAPRLLRASIIPFLAPGRTRHAAGPAGAVAVYCWQRYRVLG